MTGSLVHIRLVRRDAQPSSITHTDSWILTALTRYNDLDVVGILSDDMIRDPLLGPLVPKLVGHRGPFVLELAVELPDRLPMPNVADQRLDAEIENGNDALTICLSNQMVRLGYASNGVPYHVVAPLRGLEEIQAEPEKFSVPAEAHIALMRTVASCRFFLLAEEVDKALDRCLERAVDVFIEGLNAILRAHLHVEHEVHEILSPSYDRMSFDFLYFAVAAETMRIDRTKQDSAVGRLALNLNRAKLAFSAMSREETTVFENALKLRTDGTPRQMLGVARSFFQAGQLSIALLGNVIAAEMATRQFVFAKLAAIGVSKKVLGNLEGDIKYSHLLSLYLPLCVSDRTMLDKDLVGLLNRARDLRNKMMHEGRLEFRRDEISRIETATRAHLLYLEKEIEALQTQAAASNTGTRAEVAG